MLSPATAVWLLNLAYAEKKFFLNVLVSGMR
jgi:hypothetical protein